MSKVFGKNNAPDIKRNRNLFDLSFTNNLTTDFGKLVPFCVKEVLPGDSAEIDLSVAFRMMPMVFPVQTKMRCDMHMFYVRSRNLWKDFPDFFGNLKDGLVMPYLTNLNDSNAGVGQLHDYLGLPNVVHGSYGTVPVSYSDYCGTSPLYLPSTGFISAINGASFSSASEFLSILDSSPSLSSFTRIPKTCPSPSSSDDYPRNTVLSYSFGVPAAALNPRVSRDILHVKLNLSFLEISSGFPFKFPLGLALYNNSQSPTSLFKLPATIVDSSTVLFDIDPTIFDSISDYLSSLSGYCYIKVFFPSHGAIFNNTTFGVSIRFGSITPYKVTINSSPASGYTSLYSSSLKNPFLPVGSSAPLIPISALPARAYEQIYNAFYRDERNNPYILNDEKEYNKFLPTVEGGADSNNYTLHYRNWEQDFITTALPTPQQGRAPLVGITSTGVASFTDSESGKSYNVQLTTADDGDTVTGVSYGENLPGNVMRSLVDVVSSGISINDFRNVNAYQRWLETNIRKGFKFRDIIGSHFGVEPSYAELDMPEFIGGHSELINVSQISQTSESSSDSPLGSYAGQGYVMGSSRNKIRKYFDEPGFLIGIVSISPVPNYSQILPKMYTKRDVLDYFFPEFGHIGLQPVTYKEICPLQVVNSGDKVTDTFGYQRAWYDYLASIDEVHGEFRTTLRDFLINRVYDDKPTLSPDFLTIQPSQTNNIFSVTETNDKFIGLIHVGLKMKRPIPKYGIPKLEA